MNEQEEPHIPQFTVGEGTERLGLVEILAGISQLKLTPVHRRVPDAPLATKTLSNRFVKQQPASFKNSVTSLL